MTNLQVTGLSAATLKKQIANNIKLNRQSFYIIIQTDMDQVTKLMEIIQSIDYESKIAIVYSLSFDVISFYSKLRIYNVYLFTPADDTTYRMYDICRFCRDGKDDVQQINSWKMKLGFRRPVEFKSSFRGNYHGAKLNMGSIVVHPNMS